ncbi:MAG: hypothetical protein LLG02_10900 [Pelosinus sp.]|nr:hypothetical protein [Pelosinus sp.]
MKYFSEIIFWLVVLSWPYYRQSMQGDSIQTFTDITMIIAVILTLFGYWKRWQSGKKPSKVK